ncbi:hypothetical protein BP6252_09312 [Coleophoma cylindrospora]|uniref:Peptidase S53 domain-containing protein n=1 Tax=Coleophoma cylindrospora TaxID=1849047 RepID=A0A3D8R1Q8_9HELO|nr:hypothetical protein BP6252_09312 [Coleophoma cylindrospora]
METFQERYAPWAKVQRFKSVLVNGARDNQSYVGDASEGNLDSQYLLAVVAPLAIIEYIVGGSGPLIPDLDQPELPGSNEPYLEFLDYLLSLDDVDLPHTISSSYGENEQEIPPDYARLVCNKFGLLGARGVSMIAVDFSSGGFSDIFPRPAYQDLHVQSFLNKFGNQWNGLYNSQGRGFPDVVAQSATFTAVDRGIEAHISGTSAAAPVFAGIIALMNAARISAGQRPLGFLNPWLYSEGYKALNDITRGGSTGCTGVDQYSNLSTTVVPYGSWNATAGWDPVTGLGTPDCAKMFHLASINY